MVEHERAGITFGTHNPEGTNFEALREVGYLYDTERKTTVVLSSPFATTLSVFVGNGGCLPAAPAALSLSWFTRNSRCMASWFVVMLWRLCIAQSQHCRRVAGNSTNKIR